MQKKDSPCGKQDESFVWYWFLIRNFKDSSRINSVRKDRGRRWADAHLGRERIMTEFRPARVKEFYYEAVLVYPKEETNIQNNPLRHFSEAGYTLYIEIQCGVMQCRGGNDFFCLDSVISQIFFRNFPIENPHFSGTVCQTVIESIQIVSVPIRER